MMDLALDPSTNDLLITDFDLSLVDGIDQIAQNMNVRLRFFLGEWFLNTLVGVPYYQYFFIKNPNQIQVETFLQNEINNTPGVTEITQFSSTYDALHRQFGVTFSANTVSGNTTIEVTLP